MKSAFTLVELLVVLIIISIVAAIILPVMLTARERSRATTCLSNQRQVAQLISMWAEDHGGQFPGEGDWDNWGKENNGDLRCPDAKPYQGRFTYNGRFPLYAYAFNNWLLNPRYQAVSSIKFPATTVLIADASIDRPYMEDPDQCSYQARRSHTCATEQVEPDAFTRHLGGANYTFIDGHSHWYKPEAIQISEFHISDEEMQLSEGNDGVHPTFMAWALGERPDKPH